MHETHTTAQRPAHLPKVWAVAPGHPVRLPMLLTEVAHSMRSVEDLLPVLLVCSKCIPQEIRAPLDSLKRLQDSLP